MMKFPLAYHDVDPTTGAEGPKVFHYECVTYRYDAPEIKVAPVVTQTTTPAPAVATVTPKPIPVATPAQMTKTKTGVETTIILVLAALVSLVAITIIRKRV